MKTRHPLSLLVAAALWGCAPSGDAASNEASAAPVGQSAVKDDESQKDVVRIAVGSTDHTTLVTAVKAAKLVDALSNAGPFTVFAPTNAAFDALPKGTVDDLLKPENEAKLRGILQHHVTTSALEVGDLVGGETLSMADGGSVQITKKGQDTFVDGARIVASVRGSNGMVHVVDAVILPKK